MKALFMVGIGGFLGSITRYSFFLLMNRFMASSFPWSTWVVNILGSFILGVLFALSIRNQWLDAHLRALLMTGFCGSFTTFSTFALDHMNLVKTGLYTQGILYVLTSVIFSLLAVYLGYLLGR